MSARARFFSAATASAARCHGQGKVVGQIVRSDMVGQLIAAMPMVIMVAPSRNTAYERLSLEEEEMAMASDTIGLMGQSSPTPT
ncbi:uncharacterized protein A4U43_C06F11660 [Asparagus officinalis]|uniref:Uncharacterized protein n=1 Tax=Asparagus officinalis TaxID=4686 RepID=A0A5P1ERV7_ASPOF|nr:uncharacterized protein A4U43_C06F11660 [Asparagus officinalis]